MGPLAFFAESQSVEFGRDFEFSDESERDITAAIERQGFSIVDEPFELGEISLHLGWTLHSAAANVVNRPRSVITVIDMDADMRLKEPTNANQRFDRAKWCPGAVAGEIIQTALNPVVYQSDL